MTNPAEAVERAAARLSNDIDAFPRQFGNYLLLQMLARGGMGEVYLAKQGGIAGIEKNCVVKTLRGHFTVDREYVNRFMDEARVVVHLNHRNICQVYDVGKVKSKYYLAMEHIVGRDLRSLLQDPRIQGQFTPAMLLHIICEVLEALDYAHRLRDPATGELLNVVHRDVSPQNIMLNFEGEVKLIDFGLAASSKKVEKTQPNVVMGKMAYMAPEQARGDPVDGRADLFAVAVLAYEMLVGERFYEGMSFEEMWGVAGRGGFRPRNWDSLNPQIRTILERGLATDLELRFQTCGDFKEALSNYLFQNQMRASARDMRGIMEGALGADLQEVRDLLARFSNVRMGPVSDEESQSIVRNRVEDVTQTGTSPLAASRLPTEFDDDLNASSEDGMGAFQAMPSTESQSQSIETRTNNQVPARAPENTMILRDVGIRQEDDSFENPAPKSKAVPAAIAVILLLLAVIAGIVLFLPPQANTPAVATSSTKTVPATGAAAVQVETAKTEPAPSPSVEPTADVKGPKDPATASNGANPGATNVTDTAPKAEPAEQAPPAVAKTTSDRRRTRRRTARRSRRTVANTAPPPPVVVETKPVPAPAPPPEKAAPKRPTSFPKWPRLRQMVDTAVKCAPFGNVCQNIKTQHRGYRKKTYFREMSPEDTKRLKASLFLCESQCLKR